MIIIDIIKHGFCDKQHQQFRVRPLISEASHFFDKHPVYIHSVKRCSYSPVVRQYSQKYVCVVDLFQIVNSWR